ncbi:proline iminopeptidase [Rhabdobacter roseus]|uniref:Proline iminopeptidase n=1 Tax=Rhabdobacter roseus TaxID=1655419 RepID=A0A840TLX6_9BACT|nr:alpha/beta hydrolase [Rhabdobacter roseus]MBB5283925.1 proline iminopeptidase [Rhabdobacter roseus]
MREPVVDIPKKCYFCIERTGLILLLAINCCYGQSVKSFTNAGIQLFYEEQGTGPALYILTGGPGAPPEHPAYELMDSLKAVFTCVLLHQRGAGKSRHVAINEKTINIASYLNDIELLRRTRGDQQITLLGISWGGLLAMNYAALYPHAVSNLALLGSAPPSYQLWNVLFDNQHVRRSGAELDSMQVLQKIFTQKTDAELDSLKKADPLAKEVVAFKHFMAIHARSMYYDRTKAAKNFEELFYGFNFQPIPYIDKEVMETQWDITAALKKLKTPALILYGRQDDQGESTFFLQKECLKNSEIRVIEKCGHIMWEDQPAEFYKILISYLTKNPK